MMLFFQYSDFNNTFSPKGFREYALKTFNANSKQVDKDMCLSYFQAAKRDGFKKSAVKEWIANLKVHAEMQAEEGHESMTEHYQRHVTFLENSLK